MEFLPGAKAYVLRGYKYHDPYLGKGNKWHLANTGFDFCELF